MRTPARRARVAALLLLLCPAALGLGGCEGMHSPFSGDPDAALPDDDAYVSSKPLTAPEFEFLWERAKFDLQADGYAPDSLRSRRSERSMVTAWRTLLAPARFQGVRRRVHLRFDETAPGRYVARCAVLVQRNEDLVDPTQPARAVWKDQPADRERANLIVYRLESGFAADAAGGSPPTKQRNPGR